MKVQAVQNFPTPSFLSDVRKDGLVLVVTRQMRADLLRLSHNDPSSGHMGINRCLERLHPWYYWPGMASEVHLWVAECAVCNQQRSSSASSRAPMDSITVSQPMELWAMDIVGPLPVTAQGHQYILVMSDHFTKWIEAVPLANQKAETVARAFVENVVARHGVPVKLLTDQGSNFELELMKEVFRILGVHKLQTSAYHPQTDGQVERFNRTLKTIISSYVNSNHNDWDRHLHLALFAYRTSVHSSTQISPFKAVYGREAISPLVLLGNKEKPPTSLISNYSDELEQKFREIHAMISENITTAQSNQKRLYDERHRVCQSEILNAGDIVWLHSTVVPIGGSSKFHKPWTGPFIVLNRQGRVDYVIRSQSGKGRISCVHRNRLKLVQHHDRETNAGTHPSLDESNAIERKRQELSMEHHEVETSNSVPLRRSTRVRCAPDLYEDYNLDNIEIEDALA